MNNKGVKCLPGIAKAYGNKLRDAGFPTARSVYDKFLALEKNEEMFKSWLKSTCGANTKSQNECYSALKGWYEQHPEDIDKYSA